MAREREREQENRGSFGADQRGGAAARVHIVPTRRRLLFRGY